MSVRSVFARVGAWCVERPAPVIALAVLLAIVGAIGASSLQANGEAETLVDKGSETFRATEDFKAKFGDDAVVVLIRGDLEQLVLGPDLNRLLQLEGCLSGNAPADELARGVPTPEVCNDLADSKPARVVYGPATFLNQFARQATALFQEQSEAAVVQSRAAAITAYEQSLKEGLPPSEARAAAEAAEQSVLDAFTARAQELAARYGQTGLPSITNPTFLSSVVFDSRFADGTPKSKFSYLFPSNKTALISIRLRPDLSESERAEAIDLIRSAINDDTFRIRAGSYLVSGVPVVVDGLTDELKGEIVVLLIAALVVMALVLALVFVPPLRLLPLLIGLVASAIAFGVLALFGGTLTMASIAGLPVLIGLAVDYAIQLQARFNEARGRGSSPARAAAEAAARGGGVVATACLATAAGFTVLLLSPIPMVRSFGMLLVAGIVIAFVLALTAGLAVLSMTAGREADGEKPGDRLRGRLPTPPAGLTRANAAVRRRLAAIGPRSLAVSIAMPGRVIAAATVLALAGWIAGTRTEIISDFRELVPRNLPELQNVDVLQEETGVSGQVDVTVSADDITDPEVVAWMADFRQRVLALGGSDGQFESCLEEGAELCPAISLPDLFGTEGGVPSRERIRGVLELLPPYFSQAVVETDPASGQIGNTAVLSFGIKVMPFDEQKQLIDAIREQIDPPGSGRPPTGVDAQVVGLPVLVADANAALESNRYLLTIAGLLAVALVLFVVYRSVKRTLVPLIPVILAPGWSALVLESAGVPLNPMSATLGALVIAIATEFSVLLSARYHEEREAGASVGEALRLSYSRTGSAVVASGLTAIAGFAVLALAAPIQLLFGGDAIRMLTEFGLVAVVDLLVALAGVMLVLPAVLVGAESDFAAVRERFRRLSRRGPEAPASAAGTK
jgi:hydrophobe/amphiphile efflux-3 (HAE3) family protein